MSVVRQWIEQSDPPRSPRETLPTMYDLPSEDPEEPGLPDEYHLWQAELCSVTFRPPTHVPEQVFVASDLNLYYDPGHTGWYKRSDWFAVLGVPRLYDQRDLRLSYVLWQEGVAPIVAIEFLSPSTRDEDLGQREQREPQPTKWQVYEQILRIPYYIRMCLFLPGFCSGRASRRNFNGSAHCSSYSSGSSSSFSSGK
jgi:Uma2 family endonuclease